MHGGSTRAISFSSGRCRDTHGCDVPQVNDTELLAGDGRMGVHGQSHSSVTPNDLFYIYRGLRPCRESP